MKTILLLAMLLGVVGGRAHGAVFSDAGLFLAAVGRSVTDTYSAATYGYVAGNTVRLTDGAMSAAFGQTQYSVPSLNNADLVGKLSNLIGYCAGCNANFGLGFATTTVSRSGGVYGFGFYYEAFNATAQTGVIQFGDGTTSTMTLPSSQNPTVSYFGETSPLGIVSFTTTSASPYMVISSLTVAAAPVPEPASLVLLGVGVSACGLVRWVRIRGRR